MNIAHSFRHVYIVDEQLIISFPLDERSITVNMIFCKFAGSLSDLKVPLLPSAGHS